MIELTVLLGPKALGATTLHLHAKQTKPGHFIRKWPQKVATVRTFGVTLREINLGDTSKGKHLYQLSAY